MSGRAVDLRNLPKSGGMGRRSSTPAGYGRLHVVLPRELILRIQRAAAGERVPVSDWCTRTLQGIVP
jgi:hypothetical protein